MRSDDEMSQCLLSLISVKSHGFTSAPLGHVTLAPAVCRSVRETPTVGRTWRQYGPREHHAAQARGGPLVLGKVFPRQNVAVPYSHPQPAAKTASAVLTASKQCAAPLN